MGLLTRWRKAPSDDIAREVLQAIALLEKHTAESAEAALRKALDESRTALGQQHRLTAAAWVGHGAALYYCGRYAESEATLRELAADRAHIPGDEWALRALVIAPLAMSAQGGHAQALEEMDELLPHIVRIRGAEHSLTLKARCERATILCDLLRYEEAELEARELIALADRGRDPRSRPVSLSARDALAKALSGQSRHSEGESVAREGLLRRRPRTPDDVRCAAALRLTLVATLNGQGRHAEALTELTALPLPLPFAETGAPELARAQAYLGLDRRTEAAHEARAALTSITRVLGPAHRRTQEAHDLLHTLNSP
ncbi:tetratricopeptide repeat protein [Streptomyces sp. YC504]|uniref:Tetratricopeptide repeat protein n=1 Tax=Streptomyces mesophilus TaxID=1775132 RepID=A0A6G4XQU2_9ACTN|nr:tetratricopeptide repeat protein [Streptomyces mesophilus]NGO79074.1 tetratricopeptide repeat protein [Streptomyces mesophilus]